jgi:NitT/TauT family transport system permease protein
MSVSEASSTAAPRHHRSVRDISKYTEERRLGIVKVYLWRLLIIAVVLTSWQFLPQIHGLRHISTVFNPFFVSSPTRVAREIWTLTATNGPQAVWPYLFLTLKTSLIGTGIGILAGGLLGLVLSNDRRVRKILNPFINFANAAPKIAVIPVILVIFGATVTSSVIVGSMTAFFAVFFNAYAGGRGVAPEMVQNAYLLGATPITAMLRIRGMYVVRCTAECDQPQPARGRHCGSPRRGPRDGAAHRDRPRDGERDIDVCRARDSGRERCRARGRG